VATARPVCRLARRLGVEMPITQAVAAVLDGDLGVGDLSDLLLSRPRKPEHTGAIPVVAPRPVAAPGSAVDGGAVESSPPSADGR
jgi:hypothetical protein